MNQPAFPRQKRLMAILLIANACILVLYLSGWSYINAKPTPSQSKGKVVAREHPAPHEPIQIIGPYIKGKAGAFDEAFESSDDWIKALTFKLKNRSKTPIIFVRIDLTFPETTATGPKMLHQLFIGQRPELRSTINNPSLYLMPNESVDLSLASQYDQIKRLVELRQPPIGNIGKIAISLGEVMFADGTLYSGGVLFKRNPDSDTPRKWININDEQGTHSDN